MNKYERIAIQYLASQQLVDGGFASYSSPQLTPFLPQVAYRTTFVSALLLDALCAIEDPVALKIRKKLAAFLLHQKSEHWSFNYWARNSNEANRLPYPDDLDDTFCALSALWRHDSSILEGAGLAHAVKLLIATETEVGGPYRTWLVPTQSEPVWLDVDMAVNANIAYFLRLVAEPLPNLTHFMETSIRTHQFTSPYYPHFYPVVYYLTRAYKGAAQQQLADFLLCAQKTDGTWETPLQTALAITSLLRVGGSHDQLARAVRYLERAQRPDGSWPAEAFCMDPAQQGTAFYNGSAALTTGFALEALHAYYVPTRITTVSRPQNALYHGVIQQAEQTFAALDSDLAQQSQKALAQLIQSKNVDEIIMLPFLLYESLDVQPLLNEQLFCTLALANLYGWIAYTIYDDFLDDEGSALMLPTANVAMRQSLYCFDQALPHATGFAKVVRASFDIMDAANAWEVAHCHFKADRHNIMLGTLPSYGRLQKLSQRSIGHTLPVLGVLAAAGITPTSNTARTLQKAFQHYIIAKQLNDDAHDWRQDLAAGHITYVLAYALKTLKVKPGMYALSSLSAQIEQQFWQQTLPYVCDRIGWHIQQSRRALAASGVLRQTNVLSELLDTTEAVVAQTMQTTSNADSFLRAYTQQ